MAVSDISQITCKITDTGITAPTYDVILAWYQNQYRNIYGSDIVLDNSTQDGQWIAIQAQAVNVCNQAMITVFNSFSPAKAQGTALSSNVKINGISRMPATNSTCDVVITGDAGTVITNGTVHDTVNRYTWQLPSSVVIPLSGNITVTATCSTPGAITAPINSLTIIGTPTDGWTDVTNTTEASSGNPAENDAKLRIRQALSTSRPTQGVLEGLIGGILELDGVVECNGYENPTDTQDDRGIPPHSIAIIVMGGDATNIAQEINNRRTLGVNTYGTTSVTIQQGSDSKIINFFRPTLITPSIIISLTALSGYTSRIGEIICNNVINYINSLGFGSTLYTSRLYYSMDIPSSQGGDKFFVDSIEVSIDGNLVTQHLFGINEKPNLSISNITLKVSQ